MTALTLTRRGFIGSAFVAGLGLVSGCSITDLIPSLDDLEIGEAHLVWDPSSGALYRIYSNEQRIARVTLDGDEEWSFGGPGQLSQQFSHPQNLAPAPDGSLYVVDPGNDRIVHLRQDGTLHRLIGGPGVDDGQLAAPQAVAVDGDGVLWVADTHNHRIQSFDPDGVSMGCFSELDPDGAPGTLNAPRGLSFDSNGDIHVADAGNARIQVFDTSGELVRTYGGFGAADGQHFRPRTVAIAGKTDLAFVSDPTLGVVQVYSPAGEPLVRFDSLTAGDRSASPLDVGFTDAGLLYVRVHTWQDEEPPVTEER